MVDQAALDPSDREDPELIRDLLEMFCESLPKLLQRFDRAIETTNAGETREAAHVMKSRLRYLHWHQLGDLAAEIEKQGRLGVMKGIDAKYAELKTGIDVAIAKLRESSQGVTT